MSSTVFPGGSIDTSDLQHRDLMDTHSCREQGSSANAGLRMKHAAPSASPLKMCLFGPLIFFRELARTQTQRTRASCSRLTCGAAIVDDCNATSSGTQTYSTTTTFNGSFDVLCMSVDQQRIHSFHSLVARRDQPRHELALGPVSKRFRTMETRTVLVFHSSTTW